MNVEKINASPYDANTYLVNKKILIDTGMSPRSLYEEIKRHVDPKNIELIILTHCHYDHTASTTGLSIEFIDPVVYTYADSRPDIDTFFDNGIDNSLYRIYRYGKTYTCICTAGA